MRQSVKILILVLFSLEVFFAIVLRIDQRIKEVYFLGYQQTPKAEYRRPVAKLPQTKQPPTAIKIDKIKKNLPIQAALVRGNQWDMFSNAVAWLSTSAVPGEGNVILYAHNWPSLWADLHMLKKGDIIEVQQNQTWLSYTVNETRAVKPDEVTAILANNNQLTLYTCEGSFDQKRRVVYAVASF